MKFGHPGFLKKSRQFYISLELQETSLQRQTESGNYIYNLKIDMRVHMSILILRILVN